MRDWIAVVVAWVLTIGVWGGLAWWLVLVFNDQAPGSEGRTLASAALVIWGLITLVAVVQGLNRSDSDRGNG